MLNALNSEGYILASAGGYGNFQHGIGMKKIPWYTGTVYGKTFEWENFCGWNRK